LVEQVVFSYLLDQKQPARGISQAGAK